MRDTNSIDEAFAELEKRMTAAEEGRKDAEQRATAFAAQIDDLARRMTAVQVARSTFAGLPSLAPDEEWRDRLIAWRNTLSDELRALPSTIHDDHTLGTRTNLMLSIRAIDIGPDIANGTGYELATLRLGDLMIESGYEIVGADPDRRYAGTIPWHGSLPEVERRIAALNKQRAEAEARLEEALLDDVERERRAAANKARIDAMNAAPVRKVRGDGSQYERHADGRIVEIAS